MTQRRRHLVAYDIADKKRLRRVHRKLNGYGDPLQYSVFVCDLSPVERRLLLRDLVELINHREDRVMLADLGPVDGRAGEAVEFLGVRPAVETEAPAVIV